MMDLRPYILPPPALRFGGFHVLERHSPTVHAIRARQPDFELLAERLSARGGGTIVSDLLWISLFEVVSSPPEADDLALGAFYKVKKVRFKHAAHDAEGLISLTFQESTFTLVAGCW